MKITKLQLREMIEEELQNEIFGFGNNDSKQQFKEKDPKQQFKELEKAMEHLHDFDEAFRLMLGKPSREYLNALQIFYQAVGVEYRRAGGKSAEQTKDQAASTGAAAEELQERRKIRR